MLDLAEFLDPDFKPKPALKKKPKKKRSKEEKLATQRLRMIRKLAIAKPKPIAQILFWNVYQCVCGAHHSGAAYDNNPFLKSRTLKGISYSPIPTRFLDYKAEIELKLVKITACPDCFTIDPIHQPKDSNQINLDFFNPMEIVVDTVEFVDFTQKIVNGILKALTIKQVKNQREYLSNVS